MALILLIEDDKAIALFIQMALTDEGYQVHHAPNGRVGLEMLRTSEPKLILVDWGMPEMDGRTFVQHYRRMYSSTVPIIILTANDDITIDKDFLKIVDDYLLKPFNLDDLLKCVQVQIAKR